MTMTADKITAKSPNAFCPLTGLMTLPKLSTPYDDDFATIAKNAASRFEGCRSNAERNLLRAADVAMVLCHEYAAQCETRQQIMEDARALIKWADAAREALKARRSPNEAYAGVRNIAAKYLSIPVERGNLRTMVVGLEFTSCKQPVGYVHFLA